jgi:hypothetical protein
VNTITTHGHENRRTGGTQTAERAEVRVGEDTQHKSSDTSRNVGDVAYLLSQMASEPASTTRPSIRASSLPPTQRRSSLQHGNQPGATTTMPGTAMSGTAPGSNYKELIHLGTMVTRLQGMRDHCQSKRKKIDEERKALPEVEIQKENVKQTAEKEAELTRLLEEARRLAETARHDLEVTTTKIGEIEADEQEVKQLEADSKELYSRLGI